MGTPEQARAGSVDRSAEADLVIEYLLEGPKRLAVLYGQRGSRRRELVRDWVIPRIADRKLDAYYGDCEPYLPPTVRGLKDELTVAEALQRGGLVFLGRMERHLAVPDREKQRQLTELLGGVERGEFSGSLVLLLPKRNLAQLFAFQPVAPSLMTNVLEIPAVTFRDGLRWLSQGESGREYAPEAIEKLAAEVNRDRDGDGVELARAVDRGFARFKQDAGGVVTVADCEAIGGVPGALAEYREAQVGKAGDLWGEEGRKAVEMILEEVASASGEGASAALDDLPLRLGIGESRFHEILQWLSGDGQLLRDDGSRLEIVPLELRPAILEKTERNRRDVLRASGLLLEGLRSWTQLGVGLPRKRLEEIDAVRESLRAGEEEATLMVRSLLRIEGAQDMATIRYWLRRVCSHQSEVSLSIEAVFEKRAEIRLRAVELLEGFDEPDVRQQLHRAAIEDTDRDVRRAALASLRGMQLDELWPLISQEASETGSPYQENAVAALRLFPNPAAAGLLRELVAEGGQSSGVKAEAIETLAAMGTSEAIKSLVDIGLNGDLVNRRSAGPALASVESRDRVREAVEAIRDSTVKLEQSEPMTIKRAAGAVLRSVLSVIAATFGWPALLALGRYRAGLSFLGVYVVLYLLTLRSGSFEIFLWALITVNSFTCLLVATRTAIVDERRRIGSWPGPGSAKSLRRGGLGRPLTVTLLVLDLFPFFFLHGLAHLLIGRVRRGVTLFALECLGILCLAAGWFYFSGSQGPAPAFSVEISGFLMYLYVGVGLALFAGTLIWDLAAVAREAVFFTRRRNARERRVALFAAMAGNRWAAEYVLDRAARGTGQEAWRARRLVRRTAQFMSIQELIASVKAQFRRPRYLLESLKHLKNREETVHSLASEWPAAPPRLRRWIVDVLAGQPNERSLEQLHLFRHDLDWYGRLRYAVGIWHHRVRLWPKMIVLVGALLLPMVVFALVEAHATFNDPFHPLLRFVQFRVTRSTWALAMPDTDFLLTVQFLAKARPAKSADVLMNLFRESAASRNADWRKSVAGALGTAACEESLDGPRRAKLTTALIEGLKHERLEVVEALSLIQQDAGRCWLSEPSRKELATAAANLLKNATTLEQAQLAIIGLGAARHTLSVEPLRNFVVQLTQPRNQGKDDLGRVAKWEELQRTALRVLSLNGSEQSVEAVKEIAGMPTPLRAEARKLAQQSVESFLAAVKQPLERGDYEQAHTEGLELLKANLNDPLRFDLLTLLGEASYRLALAPEGDSNDWNGKAIDHFEQAQRIKHLDAGSRRMLAESYARLAMRLKDPAGAFRAAGQALREDPDYAGAYCVQAWLMQANHQDAASLGYALTAVGKDPNLAWSYELVQDAYLKQAEAATSPDVRHKIVMDATDQLEQLSQRYPDVMWPQRELVYVYHEFVSEFDRERALGRAYEISTTLEKKFESRLAETEKLDLDAGFLECRFTTGHYQDVIDIGGQLEQRLPQADYAKRVPVSLLRYAAQVMKGDAAGALVRLRQLESLVRGMPAKAEVTWVYNGTLVYLRAQQPQGNTQQRLIEMVEAANSTKNAKGLSPAVFEANRRALQTASAR